MPTLVTKNNAPIEDVEESGDGCMSTNNNVEETAAASDFLWFARELGPYRPSPSGSSVDSASSRRHRGVDGLGKRFSAQEVDGAGTQGFDDDASSASGSLLQAALDDMRQYCRQGEPSNGAAASTLPCHHTDVNVDDSCSTLSRTDMDIAQEERREQHPPPKGEDEEDLSRLSNINSCEDSFTDESLHMSSTHASAVIRQTQRGDQREGPKIGPNERLYREKYSHFVSSLIENGRAADRDQNGLRDYRTMSDEERQQEQQMVMDLLTRLGIGGGGNDDGITRNASQQSCSAGLSCSSPPQQPRQIGLEETIDPDATIDPSLIQLAVSPPSQTGDAGNHLTKIDSNSRTDNRHDNRRQSQSHDVKTNPDATADPSDVKSVLMSAARRQSTRTNTSRSVSFGISLCRSDDRHSRNMPQANADNDDFDGDDDTLETTLAENSLCLLSPPAVLRPNAIANHSMVMQDETEQPARRTGLAHDSDSSVSASSVEVPRMSTRQFHSPAQEFKRSERKRQASTSGKRGMDLSRPRNSTTSEFAIARSDESCISATPVIAAGQVEATFDSPGCMDPTRSHYFTTSQSPIAPDSPSCSFLPRDSDDDPDGDVMQPDISFGDEVVGKGNVARGKAGDSASKSDYNDSILYTTFSEANRNVGAASRYPLGPSNRNAVTMKQGATFHLKPLETTRDIRSRRDLVSFPNRKFPDPLCGYQGSVGRRMGRVYNKLKKRDEANEDAVAMVLSLEQYQICDVVLKLLLENPPAPSQSQKYSSGDHARGQTLIIVRDKEDLESWSRVFREGSSFSVLNHAAMPLKERKTPSTVDRCIKYDAVMTTFDAFKSSDVTVSVDRDGYVTNSTAGGEDGWFTSQSTVSEHRSTKQMSILHLANWRRVIFVDCVGRKSYLVKAGTSRALAAKSLNASSRYVYVCCREVSVSALYCHRKRDFSNQLLLYFIIDVQIIFLYRVRRRREA